MTTLREKLLLIQQISGKSQAELADVFGVTYLAFNNWINEKSIPRTSKLSKIENYAKLLGLDFKENNKNPKETFVKEIAKNEKNLLVKIIKRVDLIDELSLQITYHTNNIEGSTMTLDDTKNVLFHKKTLGNKSLNEQLEAKNHDLAFRYLLNHLNEKKEIGEHFLKQIHKILMAGILPNAGEYRNHPVRIVGSFVPTANYLKINNLITELFSKHKRKSTLEQIFKFHSDLEKIHPFSDGNGRVGRLILIAMLLQNNFPPAVIKGKVKNKYYKSLQKAQINEEYIDLNDFLLDAIIIGHKIIND